MEKLRKRASHGEQRVFWAGDSDPVKMWKTGGAKIFCTPWWTKGEKQVGNVENLVESVDNVENSSLSTFHTGGFGGKLDFSQ